MRIINKSGLILRLATVALATIISNFIYAHEIDSLEPRSSTDVMKSVEITKAWVRPARRGQNSALYLKIINNSESDITLQKACADDAATKVELHTTIDDHGIMKMQHVESIVCPAGQTTELKPGALHIMLIGLKRDLNLDDQETIAVKLHFDHDRVILIDAPVRKGPCCGGCH